MPQFVHPFGGIVDDDNDVEYVYPFGGVFNGSGGAAPPQLQGQEAAVGEGSMRAAVNVYL